MTAHARLPVATVAELRHRRGGRRYLFGSVTPATSALVVIDMQNAFVDPASPLYVAYAHSVVPTINMLASRLRDAGGPVFWVRSTFSDSGRGSWSLYFDHVAPARDGASLRAMFYPGSAWHGFWPELEIATADHIVDKDRFSAFVEGASDIEARLDELGVNTLVITGTLTNVCCESSMRDAMMRDFKCILVEDANAAQTDADHLSSLVNAARYFGDVMSASELLELVDG